MSSPKRYVAIALLALLADDGRREYEVVEPPPGFDAEASTQPPAGH